MAGIMHQNRVNTRELFSSRFGIAVYRATMTKNRFIFLTKCLRFDDAATRGERRQTDRIAAIRQVWDHIVATSKKLYSPSDVLTVDEQLLGSYGKCGFRVYIPNKPDKNGIKIVMLCDAKSSYMINAEIYAGKTRPGKGEAILAETLLSEYYLLELTKPVHGTNRTIVSDNWFTSISAVEKLLKKKIDLCRDRKEK
jgi:hypothetical protein